VLPALIVPEVLFHGNPANLPFDAARLVAALVATLVAWRTKNMLATIAAGMAALFLLKLLPS
jgi:branched-subunit amino acid transport protein